MKKFLLPLAISLLIFPLTSCSNQIHTINKENIPTTFYNEGTTVTNPSELPSIGGSSPATEFRKSFILIPNTLAHIIDIDKLPEWENLLDDIITAGIEDPYLYDNIYEFIRFFDIPRKDFEELYYSTNLYYMYDYNFDLLYSDDINKVYSYYKEENQDFLKRNTELSIKQDIKTLIGIDDFNDWLYKTKTIKYNDYYDVSWSIAEAIYTFNIPRSDIEEILLNYVSDENGIVITEIYEDGSESPITGNTMMYEYNLNMVYDDNATLEELLVSNTRKSSTVFQNRSTELKGYEIDKMIHLP